MISNLFLGRDAFIDFSIYTTGIFVIVPALFWLLFWGNERTPCNSISQQNMTKQYLLWLTIIPLGLLVSPGTSLLIQKMIGSIPLRETMIAIPTALVAAYAFIDLTESLHINKKRRVGAIVCFALLIVTASSVPIKYGYPLGFRMISNPMKIDPEVLQICDSVNKDYVLLPEEIYGQIGEFDSAINAGLISDIPYDSNYANKLAYTARHDNSSAFVIKKTYDDPESILYYGYQEKAETKHYIIYQLTK